MAATLICDMKDCKHRSKRKLKSWKDSAGNPCYGCTRPYVSILHVFDPDGDIEATAGKENMAVCSHYEPVGPTLNDEEQEDDL